MQPRPPAYTGMSEFKQIVKQLKKLKQNFKQIKKLKQIFA